MGSFPDAYAFLAGRRHGAGPVYVVGGVTERRVTLFSQQTRALNLVAALDCVHGDELAGMRIAVVGAGASGMLAASALHALGVTSVRVFDEAAATMHPQRASFTRFLHPGLFHWPEAGWDEDHAHLPLGAWDAGYADQVRNQVLRTCGAADVQFCTTVLDIADGDPGVHLYLRRLGERVPTIEAFDLAIVAAGFPAERPPENVRGGSYWHQVEGLEDQTGDIRIAGDGDGALTEVLMLFIDLLGHGVVKELARLLPVTPELRRFDLEAQGRPRDRSVAPASAYSLELAELLAELDPQTRTVTVHSEDALKGGSFLLNRVLVEHLLLLGEPSVKVEGTNLGRAQLRPRDIWRAGLSGARPPRAFEYPALSTQAALKALDGALDPLATGALVQSIDALRRPLWSSAFTAQLRAQPTAAWLDPGPLAFEAIPVQATKATVEVLPAIAATVRDLQALGVELRPDTVHAGALVSIEAVVRVCSIPHAECVRPGGPHDGSVQRDERGRLWFAMPPEDAKPVRAAVHALVSPSGLEAWAGESLALREADRAKWEQQMLAVERDTLRGLTDLSTVEPELLRSTWRAHRLRGEHEEAMRAVLRRARVPASPHGIDRSRNTLVHAAELIAAAGTVAVFGPGDQWVLLTAAAAALRVTSPTRPGLTLDPPFLVTVWAPYVRGLGAVPGWFEPLRERADEVPTPAEFRRGVQCNWDSLVTLAGAALRERGPDELRPLARFGVSVPS